MLLATGLRFDVIEVPARIGQSTARTRLGPVAVSPTGRWMFFVQPGHHLRPELAAHLDVVMHGPGSWVPAPPTRTPIGRVRWDVHPSTTGWQLPDAYEAQQVLVANLCSAHATLATKEPGLGRAA